MSFLLEILLKSVSRLILAKFDLTARDCRGIAPYKLPDILLRHPINLGFFFPFGDPDQLTRTISSMGVHMLWKGIKVNQTKFILPNHSIYIAIIRHGIERCHLSITIDYTFFLIRTSKFDLRLNVLNQKLFWGSKRS